MLVSVSLHGKSQLHAITCRRTHRQISMSVQRLPTTCAGVAYQYPSMHILGSVDLHMCIRAKIDSCMSVHASTCVYVCQKSYNSTTRISKCNSTAYCFVCGHMSIVAFANWLHPTDLGLSIDF